MRNEALEYARALGLVVLVVGPVADRGRPREDLDVHFGGREEAIESVVDLLRGIDVLKRARGR